ncbi:hypothetical protein ACC685_39090 [Rhizobium ruizarguesonis]
MVGNEADNTLWGNA